MQGSEKHGCACLPAPSPPFWVVPLSIVLRPTWRPYSALSVPALGASVTTKPARPAGMWSVSSSYMGH